MVTRAASDAALGDDVARQILAYPGALRTVGAAMIGLALIPGLPHAAFAALGIAGVAGGQSAAREKDRRTRQRALEDAKRRRDESRQPDLAVALIGVDHLSIDVGESLLPLLDEPAAGAILSRIGSLRRAMAMELGIILPSVRIRDDVRLPERGFSIRVRDRVVARGELATDRPLAVGLPSALSKLRGVQTTDPVTGLPARWLEDETAAQLNGAIVVDPVAVLTSKLAVVARENAHALLGRQEVQQLIDHVRKTFPAAIKGVVPELASLGLVQRVLQHLVRERVSIRDIVVILETIADEADRTKDAVTIGEAARRRLAPAICAALADGSGRIRAVAVSPELESSLSASLVDDERGPALGIDPSVARALASELRAIAAPSKSKVVIACPQAIRFALARFAEVCGANVTMLGFAEVAAGYVVEPVGALRGSSPPIGRAGRP